MTNKLLLFIASAVFLFSCDSTTVFEKNTDIKGTDWAANDTLKFTAEITDLAEKNLYINLRHSTAFNWRNIWLNLQVDLPNDSTISKALNVQLSQPNGQWYGDCSSDICNIQLPIAFFTAYSFTDTGSYTFSLSHEMRENPLPHILSAGLRIEHTAAKHE